MSLGPELEAVLFDTRPSRGYDASVAWCFSPESIPVEMAEPLARVWDESECAKNAFVVLVPGRNAFHVGNKPRSMVINVPRPHRPSVRTYIEGIRPSAGYYSHRPDGIV